MRLNATQTYNLGVCIGIFYSFLFLSKKLILADLTQAADCVFLPRQGIAEVVCLFTARHAFVLCDGFNSTSAHKVGQKPVDGR